MELPKRNRALGSIPVYVLSVRIGKTELIRYTSAQSPHAYNAYSAYDAHVTKSASIIEHSVDLPNV